MKLLSALLVVSLASTTLWAGVSGLRPGQTCCPCSIARATVLFRLNDGTCQLTSREVATCDLAATGLYCIEEERGILINADDPSTPQLECKETPCPVAKPVVCDPPKLPTNACECKCPPCPAGSVPDKRSDDCSCVCPRGTYLKADMTCVKDECLACPDGTRCVRGSWFHPTICVDCECEECHGELATCCSHEGYPEVWQRDNFCYPRSGNPCGKVDYEKCGCKPSRDVPCTYRPRGRKQCRVCRVTELREPECRRCKWCLAKCGAHVPFRWWHYRCRKSCMSECIWYD